MKTKSLLTLCLIILHSAFNLSIHAQGTAFTYQGRLNNNGAPASGSYDLQFAIFDAAAGGNPVGSTLTTNAVAVSNGLFSVTLDFGAGGFTGADRWLFLSVKTNGAVSFTPLTPPQKITATPYAITAGNLNGVLPSASLSGPYANAVTLNNAANSFSGNGSNLTTLNASQLTSGTVSDARLSANVALRGGGNAFTGNQTIADNLGIGTATPSQKLQIVGPENSAIDLTTGPLTMRSSVNSAAGAAVGTVSSHDLTFFTGNLPRQTITADGKVGLNKNNPATALDVNGTVTATSFSGNGVGLASVNALTLGGLSSSSFWNLGGNAGTTPGAQFLGTADDQPLEIKVNNQRALRLEPHPNAPNVIGGSVANEVTNGIYGAVIAGGGNTSYPNRVGAIFGTVVGGNGNTASGNYATAMGQFNTASGYAGTAMGYSTVAGGFSSQAGGTLAKANHDGTFVWADNIFADFTSTAANQFLIRAAGGVGINTNNPNGAALAVNGNVSVAGILNTASLSTTEIGTPAGGALELRANGQLGLRLDSAGTAANLTAPGNLSFGAQTRQMLTLFEATDIFTSSYGLGVQPDVLYFRTRGGSLGLASFAWYAGGSHSDTAFDPGSGFFNPGREQMRLDGSGQLTVYGSTGNGVYGISTSAGASAMYGENLSGGGYGVAGRTTGAGNAVYGDNANAAGWAGNFNGRVFVGGNQHFGNQTRQMLNLYNASYGIGIQAYTLYFRTDNSSPINNGFAWYQGGVHHDGLQNAGGGTSLMTLNGNGLNVLGGGSIDAGRIHVDDRSIGGRGHYGYAVLGETDGPGSSAVRGVNNDPAGWAGDFTGRVRAQQYLTECDRNVKTHFEPISARDILAKVAALPITRWSFTNDLRSAHLGPVAQDFKAAFDLGSDDKTIATVDADGVALAAIQGLNQKVDSETAGLRAENAEMKRELSEIKQLLLKLSDQKD